MRVVIARCSVNYEGRLSAHLPSAVRLIMVKADGCVAIHADGGAYKPLNWMNAPNRLIEEPDEWRVTNTKGDTLRITMEELLSDSSWEFGVDPGLQKDGVEAHLQELLAADPTRIEDGLTLVRREHSTDIGPVDLLCRDPAGVAVVIEVKRRGEIDGVEQLTRYLARMERDPTLRPLRGIFVAQSIKPQAKVLAQSRDIACVEVDYDSLRGIESPQQALFRDTFRGVPHANLPQLSERQPRRGRDVFGVWRVAGELLDHRSSRYPTALRATTTPTDLRHHLDTGHHHLPGRHRPPCMHLRERRVDTWRPTPPTTWRSRRWCCPSLASPQRRCATCRSCSHRSEPLSATWP